MINIAIVTGASSGIGEAFVKELVNERGVYGSVPFQQIWIVARNRAKLELLKSYIGDERIVVVDADITRYSDLLKIKNKLEEEKPKVGLLINCAGVGKRGLVMDKDEQSLEDTIDTNCKSLSKLTKICLPYMAEEDAPYSRRNGQRIINVASSAAFLPQPEFAAYAASKAYVVNFSRALDIELMQYNIAVTTVCPGPVKTPFQQNATDGESAEFTGFRKYIVADPQKLAKASIRAAKMGRHLFVYGFTQKALHVASKIIPTYWILKIEQLMMTRKVTVPAPQIEATQELETTEADVEASEVAVEVTENSEAKEAEDVKNDKEEETTVND